MPPRLTVITPSLNQGEFIERTLRSVFDQGYENLEYFVVDGGSTDGSVEIIRRYEDRLAWWVSEPDGGQTDALNKGLRRATGDVIAYINSDDVYLPGAFDRAIGALEAHPEARWVVGSSRFEGNIGLTMKVWVPEPPRGPRHWWIQGPWGVPQPSTFWRQAIFDELGPFRQDLHFIFDTEHNLRCVMAGLMPLCLADELAVRVLHEEAKSADISRWDSERERMIAEYVNLLTPRERRLMRIEDRLRRLGLDRVIKAASPVTSRLRRTLSQSQ